VAAETKAKLKHVHDAALHRFDHSARHQEDPSPLVVELDAVWASPCLAHVARFFPRPHIGSREDLPIFGDLSRMAGMIGGLYRRDGKRYYLVPPMTRPPLDAQGLGAAQKSLAPWTCDPTATDCGNTGSFIARAEAAFDAGEQRRLAWLPRSGVGVAVPNCADAAERDDRVPKPTAFESWMRCVEHELPRTFRYSRSIRLRAPDHGWLVLRGRRGHYAFADEVRAYDLGTGAAYVARSESGLVLTGTEVDFHAVDKQRKPEAFTGNVLAESVRELAFVALTGAALAPARSDLTVVQIPDGMAVALSERFTHSVVDQSWGSSAQTKLSFTIVDGTKLVTSGSFLYPRSSEPAEERADEVLGVMEAGLERGCPRATIPLRLGRSGGSGVSPLDADPARQVGVALDLERAIEGLRTTQPCKP
jgi:hypothetical protein